MDKETRRDFLIFMGMAMMFGIALVWMAHHV